MSSPVNPILVVKNNLPDYKEELLTQREKLMARVNEIDADLVVLDRLQAAL